MKKIFNMLLLGIFVLPMFTACETDDKSNPTLNEPSEFTLNVPPYAANNVYDLKNSKTVELTCSQPDYGFPVATTYNVQVSLDSEFTEKNGDADANYIQLETACFTAKMEVVASELNAAILDLWAAKHEGQELPADPMSVYVRLKAFITGSDRGTCFSNIIQLPSVLATNENALEIPKKMFLVGSMLDDWKVWKPMVMVTGLKGQFWSLVYFEENAEFKFGTKEKEYIGSDDARWSVVDGANSGVKGSNNGNIVVPTAGWYIVYMKTSIKNGDYVFAMTFYPGDVYLSGETTGGVWGFGEEWKFTAPATGDGSFVSPAMKAAGEVRMNVKLEEGVDWWRVEFTLLNGTIFYRESKDISKSWSENVGAEYSIQGVPGKKMELNFTAGTGEMK